jgi:hypothetical protein
MRLDHFLLQTMFLPLIADLSTFNSCAISVSVIDCANRVATFLRLYSILKLCVTKITLCNVLFVKVMFMHFEEVVID